MKTLNWFTALSIANLFFLYALVTVAFLTQATDIALLVASVAVTATAITSGVLSLHFTRARAR